MSRFLGKCFVGLLLVSLFLSMLAGCADKRSADQCLRRDIFKECMASLPSGPERTMYNDWAEVVSECEKASYYQSLRQKAQIKLECRP